MGRLLTWTHPFPPRLPVDNKFHYHTMPVKWLQKTRPKIREDSLHTMWAWFLHSTNTPNPADNLMQNLTAQHYLYTLTVQIHLVWGKFFNELSSESPDMKGVGRVKGHNGQPIGRCTWHSTYDPSWLQAASVASGQNSHSSSQYTSRQQHTIHVYIL